MRRLAWCLALAIPLACSDDGVSPADTDAASGGTTGGLGGSAGDGGGDGLSTAADDAGSDSAGTDGNGTGAETGGGGPAEPGYCEDVRPWPDESPLCFATRDCMDGWDCSPTGDPGSQCGACEVPLACDTTADCAGDNVCGPAPQGECVCPKSPLACQPACPAAPCADDAVCQPDGLCALRSCEDDWTCADTHTCDPAAKDADGHGCAPLSCADGEITCPKGYICGQGIGGTDANGCALLPCDDPAGLPCGPNLVCESDGGPAFCHVLECITHDDCDCGSCVQGLCREAPGVCVPPPPP